MKRLILTVVLLVPAPLAAYWDMIDLGELSQDNYAYLSINNQGVVVGDYRYLATNYHAASYDPFNDDSLVDLGTLPGGITSKALCINDLGRIVGLSYVSGGYHRACEFNPTGNGSNIEVGPSNSMAYSINNSGQIVGMIDGKPYLFDNSGQGNHVFLGGIPGDAGYHGTARDINDSGSIIGGAGKYAVLYDSSGNGNNINLGTLGGDSSDGISINNNGKLIGYSRNSEGYPKACLFDESGNGNNIDLGALGGDHSYAFSINNLDQVVGYATDASGKFRACLFDISGDGNNIDLNTLIAPDSGWFLYRAQDINDHGWIVGWGINPDDEMHAFLMIPEPCSLFLLSLGGLIGLSRRRR